MGEQEAALAAMDKAIFIAKQHQLRSLTANALTNRALLLSRLNRFEEAILLCRQAQDQSAEVNNTSSFEVRYNARTKSIS